MAVGVGDPPPGQDRRREGAETERAGRGPDLGIEMEGLREDPAVTRVDHRREDAMSGLCRDCRASRPASNHAGDPAPITWRVGGLGEPRARLRAACRPAGARRRAAVPR